MPVLNSYRFDPSLNVIECPECKANFVIAGTPVESFEDGKCYCPCCGYPRCFDKEVGF